MNRRDRPWVVLIIPNNKDEEGPNDGWNLSDGPLPRVGDVVRVGRDQRDQGIEPKDGVMGVIVKVSLYPDLSQAEAIYDEVTP